MSKKREQQLKKQRHRERMAAKKKKQRIQALMLGTVAVVVLAVIGVGWYQAASNGSGSTQGNETSTGASSEKEKTAVERVQFNYSQQPRLGEKNAPVKIVEFGDYRCPTCRQFDEKFFPKLKKDFIETGKAAYYFINFPILGDGSIQAALAAESVYHTNPDGFWEYHDAIYDRQGKESEEWVTPELLVNLAKRAVPGIDVEQLEEDIMLQTYLENVQSDKQKGKTAGVTGTPTIFVNGKMLDVKHTFQYPLLKEAINKAYEKATN